MIAVYTPYRNARLEYVFILLFDWYTKNSYRLYTNLKDFENCTAKIKISYTNQSQEVSNSFLLYNSEYLDKTDAKKVNFSGKGKDFRMFTTDNNAFGLQYDLPAMLYYLLARVEEINAPEDYFDYHRRFDPKHSLAFKYNFLDLPLCDLCVNGFFNQLSALDSLINLPDTQTVVVPTIDLDNGFAFRGKSFFRRFAGAFRQILRGYNPQIPNRFFIRTDVLDTYKEQSDFFNNNKISPIYFVQCSEGGKYNINIRPTNPYFQSLVNKLQADVGLHPSYQRMEEPFLLNKEKNRLEKACDQAVVKVRQHFIRFQVQEYYAMLEKSGFTDDYSMGYATALGFRASTAKPYPFFNHTTGKKTGTVLHPFCCMDGTFIHSLKLDANEAKEKMYRLHKNIKTSGGIFYFIWHDTYLSQLKYAKPWKNLFYTFLKDVAAR